MTQQRSAAPNWLAFLPFGIATLAIAWLGSKLTGSLAVGALLFLLMALATLAALRSGRGWLRILGTSVVLLVSAVFAYAVIVFYLNYG